MHGLRVLRVRYLPVGRADGVVGAQVVQWLLEDLDRRLVVGLGVVYDDEPHREAVRFAAGEIEVPVVTRVFGVLVIRGRNESALHRLRAIEAGVLAVEERERARGIRVRR